ncbi:hypothetical protein [Bacteriophage sp.]|nr:hypothetical protein [Bacteriophage sp.]
MRLSQVGGEGAPEATGMEKAGAAARGVASGVLGGLGDIEYFATQTVPEFFGQPKEKADIFGKYTPEALKGRYTVLPTSEEVEKGFQAIERGVGAKEGVRPELEGYRTGGEFVGGLVSPGKMAQNLLKKPVEKGMELISRARGKPFEKALSELTTTAEDLTGKAGKTIAEKEAKGIEESYTAQRRQEINLRDAQKQFDATAQRAKQESVTALNKVGKPTNEYEVGEKLRNLAKGTEKQLSVARERAAQVLKDAYFAEGKASEKAGKYWSQSKTGNEFLKYLQDVTSPANAGKYTREEVLAAQDLMGQLSGVKVGGKIVRSEIEKIEKIIRDTKKIANKPTMTGADALKQQNMGKLAEKLEDSVYGYVTESGKAVEGFAPTGRTFREVYSKMSQPLNVYESQVGKVLTQEVEGLKGIFQADASQIANKVFQSPEQIRILEKMDISKKALEPLAAQHTANQLSKFNSAEKIKEFINSTQGAYLKEFPDLAKKVNEYAKTFERNEALAEKSAAGAEKLGKRAKDISGRAAGKRERLVELAEKDRAFVSESAFRVQNATTKEQTINQAQNYILGLKERGLIPEAEAAQLLEQVKKVRDAATDKAAALTALKGVLPYAGAALGGGAVAGYSLNKLLGGL